MTHRLCLPREILYVSTYYILETGVSQKLNHIPVFTYVYYCYFIYRTIKLRYF